MTQEQKELLLKDLSARLQYGVKIQVNDKIEFVESSDGTIIEIIGNRIYPVSVGSATLTIRSYVAKSIKAVIAIKVVDGIHGRFVAMPSRKTRAGEFKDVCFPIKKEIRDELEKTVLDAYSKKLEEM